MPELPEVETIRRELNNCIIGEKIESVWSDAPSMLRPSEAQFVSSVVESRFLSVGRRAKLLIFHLSKGKVFVGHLKLNGQILVRTNRSKKDLYAHVIFHLASGKQIRFADSRKFGYLQLTNEDELAQIISAYGPEPLDDLTVDEFAHRLLGTSRRVKDVLMDQKVFSGVGNIYANDALWMARIHPSTRADLIDRVGAERLFAALESVLKEALVDGGASDQWFRHTDGSEGSYQNHFKVYGRTGEDCLYHKGEKIRYLKVSQRGTFICPKCQRLSQSVEEHE